MHSRHAFVQLTQIQKLAQLSQVRAMAEAGVALRTLAESAEAHRSFIEEERTALAGWSLQIGGAAPSPELLLLWQHRLADCRTSVAESEHMVAQARGAADAARTIWHRAHDKAEVLSEPVLAVRKRVGEYASERLLAMVEDMHLYRSVRG